MIIIECQNGDVVDVNHVYHERCNVYGVVKDLGKVSGFVKLGEFKTEQEAKEVKKEIFKCICESQVRVNVFSDPISGQVSQTVIPATKAIYSLRKEAKHEN